MGWGCTGVPAETGLHWQPDHDTRAFHAEGYEARPVVMDFPDAQDPLQVVFADGDQIIETLAAKAAE